MNRRMTVHGLQAAQREFAVGCTDAAQHERAVLNETSTAAIGRALRPKGESMQPRRAADSSPGICKFRTEPRAFVHKIDEQLTVRRKVTFLFVDPPLESSSVFKGIGTSVPLYEVIPLRRTPAQDDGRGYFLGDDHEHL